MSAFVHIVQRCITIHLTIIHGTYVQHVWTYGFFLVVQWNKGDIMSKPRKVNHRKRKTGYINLVKPNQFRNEFSSFAELAAHFASK